VLLVSGGLCLSPSARVCSYPTAGTDTNPIFLFNRLNIESDIPRTLAWTPGQEFEIPTGHTLAATLQLREKLGVEIFEVSKEIFAKSQVLIHDQHLQHLGWGAVVCNLEDIVGVFGGRIRGDVRVEELDLDVVEGLVIYYCFNC
jgi:RB1-inducible coiled-coil protein 1